MIVVGLDLEVPGLGDIVLGGPTKSRSRRRVTTHVVMLCRIRTLLLWVTVGLDI